MLQASNVALHIAGEQGGPSIEPAGAGLDAQMRCDERPLARRTKSLTAICGGISTNMWKYRYKVLEGTLRQRIRTIIRQVCKELGVQIVSGVLSKEHAHI
jgi:hypothetical protein